MTASTRAHIELSGAVGLSLTEGEIHSDDPAEFWLRGVHWTFGDVLVSDLAVSPVSASPSGALSTDHDYLSIAFLLSGDITIDHHGNHLRFASGTAAFLTSIFTLAAVNSVPSRVLLVSVPRELLAGHGIEPTSDFGALSYSALLRDPLLPFLKTLLPIIQNHSIPTEPTATILVQLVAALFIADAAQISSGRMDERALRYAAEEEIGRAYRIASFDSAALAGRLQVTETELNTVFGDTGGGETVTATITARRLTRAISMLGAPVDGALLGGDADDVGPLSILEAAVGSGFGSIEGLEAAVQATYGMSVFAVVTGLRRLNGFDNPDLGGVQKFVGRVRGVDPLSP
ncbi:hypothetical protein B7R21_14550 [Subtercola boreus]|uniref:Uncharacterized protein n=1 Tax=Subtercola boreus TaxID=120213 RepID=A0A3E0VDG6_9MICO|nr:hypothetical protein [Subtercola boreus]RFA07420.1 hypothetical protein B7R21_14550 [Subtercola boreus]